MTRLLTSPDNHSWKSYEKPNCCYKGTYEVPKSSTIQENLMSMALMLDLPTAIPRDVFSLSEFPSSGVTIKESNSLFDDLESDWNDIIEPTPFREGTSLATTSGGKPAIVQVQVQDSAFEPKAMDSNSISLLPEAREVLSLLLPSRGDNRKRSIEPSKSASKRARPNPTNGEKKDLGVAMGVSRQDETINPRFRVYQDAQWQEQFEALLKYKQQFGHCNVPHTYEHDLALSRWVKRQRCQYKLKLDGKRTSMSAERQQKLDDEGFVWDPHTALWETRRAELLEYRAREGNCNVPCRYAKNPQLGMWVRSQRREYKLLCEGQLSRLTPERYRVLDDMGFVWEPRAVGRTNKKATS
ncbi:unnamed protein product [Cylindrotheca closterium]|uniref:Helicase-associated domain-containing protein n=1 Tax=Cylindrotheca closterium TaxID=2856 RepID=A0AAD2FK69_9STRA|nr:unnamed protein product [Cylindrotheca closterium]